MRTQALVVLAACLLLGGCRKSGGGAQFAAGIVQPPTTFVWSGALTPTSIRIVAGLRAASDSVRLRLDPEPDTLRGTVSDAFTLAPGGAVITAALDHLTPGVQYAYSFEAGGEVLLEGTFRTPEAGPFSFGVAASGCSSTGSNRPVFEAIRERDPLFFLHLGDMHYTNIAVNQPDVFRRAYGRVLRAPRQAALYADTPIAYVWDDHDFGPNDSDRTAPGREAAWEVYRELVPHYSLPAEGPIYQAFTVGRVRFILTDLRSMRDPKTDGERTIMGAEQKAWFERELLAANRRFPLIVWVSTVPWIADASPQADHWGGFATERREIADFIADNSVEGLVILAGDGHMVAMDDGTNSDYTTDGDGPAIPVIHAAALDRNGSEKGGPYSEGAYPVPSAFPPHPGQWVWMEVTDDDGPEVCATWTGLRTASSSTETDEVVSWGRCFAAPLLVERSADSAVADSLVRDQQPTIAVSLSAP